MILTILRLISSVTRALKLRSDYALENLALRISHKYIHSNKID
jgi:hypothetical protein